MRGKRTESGRQERRVRIIPARAGQTAKCRPYSPPKTDHPRACGANTGACRSSHASAGSSPRVRGKPGWGRKRKAYLRIIPARAGQTTSAATSPEANTDHPRACGANRPSAGRGWRRAGSSPRVRGKLGFLVDGDFPGRIIPARAGQTSRCTLTVASRPDHPRACGANLSTSSNSNSSAGSSPRVRGKRPRARDRVDRRRIIPARAGQTQDQQGTMTDSPDHPRACGANPDFRAAAERETGSSPRVRGKRSRSTRHCRCSWIIPARAGQTQETSGKNTGDADHPRACGANESSLSRLSSTSGSSPRVRGKQLYETAKSQKRRIIPARAGQTGSSRPPWSAPSDHPRACGANKGSQDGFAQLFGSSPRVRGKRTAKTGQHATKRIIPARAGQTRYFQQRRFRRPDHPRACGANAAVIVSIRVTAGSSPRVRGKPHLLRVERDLVRIIPARAGQTRPSASHSSCPTDHPRACGANFGFAEAPFGDFGSSPRVRGKPGGLRHRPVEGRIIPARAGQTSDQKEPIMTNSDHPRACGANIATVIALGVAVGSSPRVRGKRPSGAARHAPRRIIPARAGQTGDGAG